MTSRSLGKMNRTRIRRADIRHADFSGPDCKEHPLVLFRSCSHHHRYARATKKIAGPVRYSFTNRRQHRDYCPKCFPDGCPTCGGFFWNGFAFVASETEEEAPRRSGNRMEFKKPLVRAPKGHDKRIARERALVNREEQER